VSSAAMIPPLGPVFRAFTRWIKEHQTKRLGFGKFEV
jgi:hypothetical protein